jgi:hypothetical protein
MAYSDYGSHDTYHTRTEAAPEPPSQAMFLGRLALVLAVIAILFAAFLIVRAATFGPALEGGRVDQAGSSNPQALPSPQPAKPTNTTPNAAPAPAPEQLPVPGKNAPAAAAKQQ